MARKKIPTTVHKGTIARPNLTPWFQEIIFYLVFRILVLCGGRRSGKTTALFLDAIRTAKAGGTVIWASADKETADAGWAELVEFVRPFADRVAETEEGVVEFDLDDGTGRIGKISRRSAYKASSGRGMKADLVIIDEAHLIKQSFFKRLLPVIATRQGRLALLFTPPETPEEIENARWLRDMVFSEDANRIFMSPEEQANMPPLENEAWTIVRRPTEARDLAWHLREAHREAGKAELTWEEYLELGNKEMALLEKTMGEDDFAREMLLAWPDQGAGAVIKNWRESLIKETAIYRRGAGEVQWWIDRAEGGADHVLLMTQKITEELDADNRPIPVNTRYVIFDEISTKRLIGEEEMLTLAAEISKEKGYPSPALVVFDIRAAGYETACFDAMLPYASRSWRIVDQVKEINRVCRDSKIEVNPNCRTLIRNLRNWSYDNKGVYGDKDNDAAQAMAYGVLFNKWIDSEEDQESLSEKIKELAEDQSSTSSGVMTLQF